MTKQEYVQEIDRIIAGGPFSATWPSLTRHRTPDWYHRGKLGIFVHWGIYSVPAFGNEWYSRNMYNAGRQEFAHHQATYGHQKDFGYKDFIPLFKGEGFNAEDGFFMDSDEKAYTPEDFRFTYKDGCVYAFGMRPEGKNLTIRTMATQGLYDFGIEKVELLGHAVPLPVERDGEGLHLILPEAASGETPCACGSLCCKMQKNQGPA